MPSQDTVKWSSLCLLLLVAVSRPTRPLPGRRIQGLRTSSDKKFNDNGHMITIGVNFHF